MLDLNTWLAAAAEDCNADHEGDAERHGQHASVALSAFANSLDRGRLDLDPPGFSCKAFQDLTVRQAAALILCLQQLLCCVADSFACLEMFRGSRHDTVAKPGTVVVCVPKTDGVLRNY